MLPGHFIPPKDQSGAAFWPVNFLFWLFHQIWAVSVYIEGRNGKWQNIWKGIYWLITKYFIHKGSITWQDKIIICIVLSEWTRRVWMYCLYILYILKQRDMCMNSRKRNEQKQSISGYGL